jgi:hypothetical protein
MFIFGVLGLAAGALAGPEPIDGVVRALSARDAVPCADVEALTATPVETLRSVVSTVSMPPWVPMRAAQCLIERHAVDVQPDLERWVVDPATQGLGRMVLSGLDRIPIEVALPVARKALAEAPDRAMAQQKVSAALAPEIRALVAP